MRRLFIGGFLIVGIVGVSYLATLGCCQMIGSWKRSVSIAFSKALQLTPVQREAIASEEKSFLAAKQAGCESLCAKRAQLIQFLRQPQPDRAAISSITEEIGQEQVALEKATLEHLLAVSRHLNPAQREKMTALVTEQLRTACKMTACGATPGCAIVKQSSESGARSSE